MTTENKYHYTVGLSNDKKADGYDVIHFDAITSERGDDFVMFQAVSKRYSFNVKYVVWVESVPIGGIP